MNKLLLSLLVSSSVSAAPLTFVHVPSGYDCMAGTAMSSDGNLNTYTALGLSGYLYISNLTGTTSWMIPRQFFVPSMTNNTVTNMYLTANILTTNGPDVAINSYVYYFRVLLYTNVMNTNSVSFGSVSNRVTPYYDSGNLTITGIARNGTNITQLGYTNTFSNTNLLSLNTNIAFGVFQVTHNGTNVVPFIGTHWILNGRILTK